MKKAIVALCTVATISLCSCSKEDNTPKTPEGVYNPEAKISEVYENGALAEHWNWSDDLLMSISNGENITTSFTYNGNRVSSINITSPIEAIATPSYNGNFISSLAVESGGLQLVHADIIHNGSNKLSHADLDINETMVNFLIELMLSDSNAFFNQPLTRLLGRPVTEEILQFASLNRHNESKLTVNNITVGIDFVWNGNNVSQMLVNAHLQAGITMAEIAQIIDLTEYLGELAEIAAAIPGEQPLEIVISDTIDYTYDTQKNPKRGFLGSMDVSSLSKNNILTSHTHGITDLGLTVTLPFIGERPFNQSRPTNSITTLHYDYNENGFPVKATESNETTETVKEYIYIK